MNHGSRLQDLWWKYEACTIMTAQVALDTSHWGCNLTKAGLQQDPADVHILKICQRGDWWEKRKIRKGDRDRKKRRRRTALGLCPQLVHEEIYESWHFPLKSNHGADRPGVTGWHKVELDRDRVVYGSWPELHNKTYTTEWFHKPHSLKRSAHLSINWLENASLSCQEYLK